MLRGIGLLQRKFMEGSDLMLLAIDTCGALGGVALGNYSSDENPKGTDLDPSTSSGRAPGRSGLWSRELAGKTYSELLLSTIADMLSEANVKPSQLSGIVVVHGPGSFTGIRIGVSAAKGLAEGLAIPVIALSRLDLMAGKALGRNAAGVLDAGRGEFYAGFYRNGLCETELLLTRDALAEAVKGSSLPLLVCETGVFSALGGLNPELVAAPVAADALRVGAERFQAGLFEDVSTLDANYLRRSETEMLDRIAKHAAQRVAVPATSAAAE
jgi:tRNA threonylcarbamoyladenosine biosynthesis protein TsaB